MKFMKQKIDELTSREIEVLTLVANGISNKKIATQLNISTRTVETHRQRIMKKLGICHVAGLTKYAIKKGLVTLDS